MKTSVSSSPCSEYVTGRTKKWYDGYQQLQAHQPHGMPTQTCPRATAVINQLPCLKPNANRRGKYSCRRKHRCCDKYSCCGKRRSCDKYSCGEPSCRGKCISPSTYPPLVNTATLVNATGVVNIDCGKCSRPRQCIRRGNAIAAPHRSNIDSRNGPGQLLSHGGTPRNMTASLENAPMIHGP